MARQARKRAPTADRILNAALDLAARMRWRDVTMEMIAIESGATMQRVQALYPSKTAFVTAFMRQTTDAVLAGHDFADMGEPVRDRLLDVLMRRFEALAGRKDAVRSIVTDMGSDPAGLLCAAPAFLNAMAWSLEAAGVRSGGPLGMMRVKGVAAIYVSTMRVWLRDDSEDLSPTMAHLDRRLERADALMRRFAPPRRRPAQDAA